MSKFLTAAKRFLAGESGATIVEYGFIVALIAIVAVVSVTSVGAAVASNFSDAATGLAP